MTEPTPDRVRVHFDPDGAKPREVRVPAGATLFDAASWNGIAVDSTCGGHGTCRKCKMQVLEGEVAVSRLDPRAFSPDELRAGWRLACRAQATQDLRVKVPPLVTRPKAATVGVGRQVILRPALQKRCVELSEPTLADQRTDIERLRDALDDLDLRVDLAAVRSLSRAMRAGPQVTAVVVDDVLIDVEPGDTSGRRFGVAFDLGTTTVVATLLDLATGTPVAVASMLNPQQPYGADVITRISATMMDPEALGPAERARPPGARPAHRRGVRRGRGRARGGVRDRAGGQRHHDPPRAGHRPRAARGGAVHHGVPLVRRTCSPPTSACRCTRGPGRTCSPRWGAYVGGDIVAGALASGMDRDRRIRLFIDIGTNCEILLASGDRLLATAAPGRAGVRGRGHPLRHARRPGRGRGCEDQRRRRAAAGHRGRRTPRAGRFRVGRRRRGAGRGGPRRRLRAADPGGCARTCRRVWPHACNRSARSGCSCCTSAAATPPTRCICPSATSASCSSPRRLSPPAGPCCWRSRA